MRQKKSTGFVAGAFLIVFLTSGFGGARPTPSPTPPPITQYKFKKVFMIIFENTNLDKALGQSYFGELAEKGALFSNFHALKHPSQPNYVAIVSGSTHGVTDDGTVDLDERHLGDLLEQGGKTWKSYAEAYPGNCFTRSKSGTYVRKHEPFINFQNIQNDLRRCNRSIVNSDELARDIQQGTLPDYSLYIPDMDNDAHDTSIEYANNYLRQVFDPIFYDPRFMKDMLVIVTFDESAVFGGNHIYTVFYGDSVVPGKVSGVAYDHYSVLRTIEEAFHLGTFGLEDQQAHAITDVWKP